MCAYRHVVSVPCPMASANLFFIMSSLLGSSNPKDRDGVFSPLVTPCDSQTRSVPQVLVYLLNRAGGETGKCEFLKEAGFPSGLPDRTLGSLRSAAPARQQIVCTRHLCHWGVGEISVW